MLKTFTSCLCHLRSIIKVHVSPDYGVRFNKMKVIYNFNADNNINNLRVQKQNTLLKTHKYISITTSVVNIKVITYTIVYFTQQFKEMNAISENVESNVS